MAKILKLVLFSFNLFLVNNILAHDHSTPDSTSHDTSDSANNNIKSSSPDILPEVLDFQAPSVPVAKTAPNLNPAELTTKIPVVVTSTPAVKPAAQRLSTTPKLVETKQTLDTDQQDFVSEVNTNQEAGNWVQKRIWWEQAEAAFAQLTEANNAILQIQTKYFQDRASVEKQLDVVLCDLNVSHLKLVKFIDELLESIEQAAQSATPAVSDTTKKLLSERLRNLAIAQQESLKNIKQQLVDIQAIDDAFDQVLDKLNEQIDQCSEYEKQAWDDFKEIGRILNDKKAKALFYQVDGYQQNIQKVFEYVTGPFQKFFADQMQKVKNISDDLSQEIKKLSNGGLDLRLELDILAGRAPEPVDKRAEQLAAAKKAAAKANQSWFSSVSETITSFLGTIWSWIAGLFK